MRNLSQQLDTELGFLGPARLEICALWGLGYLPRIHGEDNPHKRNPGCLDKVWQAGT